MKSVAIFLIFCALAYASPRKYHYVPTEQFRTEEVDDDVMHPDSHDEIKINPNAFQPEELTKEFWLDHGMRFIENKLNQIPNTKRAKNVILFIGDGMGHTTVATTRMAMGNENINLSFEEFPYVASSKTYCVDEQVADSACSATAYLHGVKGNSMTIGVNGNMRYMDCADTGNRNKHTESFGLWAQRAGKSTGIVTTTRVTHASPAGVYSNTASRYWEDDWEISIDRCDPAQIDDIAKQLIHGEVGSNVNVIFGGGSRNFIPNTMTEHNASGRRRDGRHLINEWLEAKPNRTYINNREALLNLDVNQVGDVIGLFHSSHLTYNLDAIRLNRREQEPTLSEMSVAAVDILSRNEEGFFLFIEGGRIDHGHHATESKIALDETVEFADAIRAVAERVNLEETLIIVTADHSHVFNYAGYPVRGNDIYGVTGANAQDGMGYFTLSYANGPSFARHRVNGTRVNPASLDTSADYFEFPSMIRLSSETHAGEDVGIWSIGPWAHLLQGTVEQSFIPHVMAYASCVGNGLQMCDTE